MKKPLWYFAIVLLLLTTLAVRLFRVTQSPPSPYWEEAALGYDAYSLSETGKDHHGNSWPVIAFESFGDWKPSGYFYALIPFIRTFGLTVLAVRLPAVLAGVSIAAGLGVLFWQFSHKILQIAQRQWGVLLTLGLAAFSPWLIVFSRAGWEVNLATAFILWGVIMGWQAVHTKQSQRHRFIWLSLSIVLLFAAMYTYHSARILAPALGIWIGWQFLRQDLQAKLKNIWLLGYVLPLFLTAFLLRPFTAALGTPLLGQRAAETSIFSDLSVIEESNRLQSLYSHSLPSRLFFHRYVLFGEKILEQFLSHFTVNFLFISGDANPRHSAQYFGLLYPFEILFLLTGFWWLARHLSSRGRQLLCVWLVFGVLPAAMTVAVPHALRILPAAPVFLLTVSFGLLVVLAWLKQWQGRWLPKYPQWLWPVGIVMLYLFNFFVFYRHLLLVYPVRYAGEWQYGYQQMIEKVENLRREHPELPVYITREAGRPAIYYWFYTVADPRLVQQAEVTAKKDQGEFLEFENITFINSIDEAVNTPAITAHLAASEGLPVWQVEILGK